jgi:beta-lactam-binding protein with PASTA domain
MLLGLGAIALVVIGFVIAYLLTHRHHNHQQTTVVLTSQPQTTTGNGLAGGGVAVPDVRKLKVAQAVSVLKSVGLKPRTTGGSSGTIVSESPNQGAKVAKGSEVLLVVNGAKPKPATTTAQTTTAQTTTAQTTTAQSTTQQQTTTSSAPSQPTSATVPDLSGMDEQAAATALGKAGLLASLAFVPSQDELGTVEAQGKDAGTTVPYHSHVLVNISTGPGNKPQETVPDVIGKTLQQALSAINGAHLRLIYLKYPVTSQSQAGKVVSQTPDGGAHAPQNAQVIVYLGALQK